MEQCVHGKHKGLKVVFIKQPKLVNMLKDGVKTNPAQKKQESLMIFLLERFLWRRHPLHRSRDALGHKEKQQHDSAKNTCKPRLLINTGGNRGEWKKQVTAEAN